MLKVQCIVLFKYFPVKCQIILPVKKRLLGPLCILNNSLTKLSIPIVLLALSTNAHSGPMLILKWTNFNF